MFVLHPWSAHRDDIGVPVRSGPADGWHATSATYPGSAAHISTVRTRLRSLLAGCPLADDVILCVSELAANAAVHSHSARPGGEFTVRAALSPYRQAWIAVDDNGGPWVSPASDAGPDAGRSHGLDIIRALASAWGIDGDCDSRSVWARFDWHL
ncbi:MAG: ATP-binding protein [Streptosporangiaceae bacterium]